jgi:hypothetical protein
MQGVGLVGVGTLGGISGAHCKPHPPKHVVSPWSQLFQMVLPGLVGSPLPQLPSKTLMSTQAELSVTTPGTPACAPTPVDDALQDCVDQVALCWCLRRGEELEHPQALALQARINREQRSVDCSAEAPTMQDTPTVLLQLHGHARAQHSGAVHQLLLHLVSHHHMFVCTCSHGDGMP